MRSCEVATIWPDYICRQSESHDSAEDGRFFFARSFVVLCVCVCLFSPSSGKQSKLGDQNSLELPTTIQLDDSKVITLYKWLFHHFHPLKSWLFRVPFEYLIAAYWSVICDIFFLVFLWLEAFKPFEGSNIFPTTDKTQNNPHLGKKNMIIPNHPKCKSYGRMAKYASLFVGKFHAPTSSDLLYHARNPRSTCTTCRCHSVGFSPEPSDSKSAPGHSERLSTSVAFTGGRRKGGLGSWENSATVENLKNAWRCLAIPWKLTAILPLRIDILKRIHESFNHWISEFLLSVSGRVIICIYSKWIEWDSEASSWHAETSWMIV